MTILETQLNQFERIEEIERHKTIERPLSELRELPRPGYIPDFIQKKLDDDVEFCKMVSGIDESLLGKAYPELPIPQPKRKYTKKAKK